MNEWSGGSTRLELRCAPLDSADPSPGVWRAVLDGRRCRTERQFLSEAGIVFAFPAYYGHNWDAFGECFGDLLDITDGGMGHEFYDRPGRPEATLHVVVDHAEDLLSYAAPRFLAVALRIFRQPYPNYDPPQLWHSYADLRVTLVCSPHAIGDLVARLTNAGLFHPVEPASGGGE